MRKLLLGGCIAAALVCAARGGGGPLNTLVVVNDFSPLSQEVGLRYARARGIPESRLFHVHTTHTNHIPIAAWSNELRNPILDALATPPLSNVIDTVVFAPDLPFRVSAADDPQNLWASLTACMYYDFYASTNAFAVGCQLNPNSANAYYKADRAFQRALTPGGRYLVSALLTGATGDEARRLAERTAAADYSAPTGSIHLLRTSDGLRSVRWQKHEEADFRSRLQGRANTWLLSTADAVPATNNVLGYMTGAMNVGDVGSHDYLPGAYADHLTSFGGILFGPNGQMPVTDWLRAGAGGSSGTVVEPCAYTEKFADPLLYAWYERGFSLGEAYFMSIRNPYQNLFTGDPLLQPYARPAAVSVAGVTNGAVVSGVVTLQVAAVASDTNRPVARVALFRDEGEFVAETNAGIAPGNLFQIVLNTRTVEHVAVAGDTLFSVASNLAAAVNDANSSGPPPNRIPFRATNLGDSVQITWTNFGLSGAGQSIRAEALQGTAPVLRARAWATSTNFMDPSHPAHEVLELTGMSTTGDTLTTVITLTNGVVVTNSVLASGALTAYTFLGQLQAAINAEPLLQGADGVRAAYLQRRDLFDTAAWLVLEARAPGPGGISNHVVYSVTTNTGSTLVGPGFSDAFNDNVSVLRPRALVRLADGATNLLLYAALNTTGLPNGPLRLDAVALEGSAVRAQGRSRIDVVVSNHAMRCEWVSPPSLRHVLRGAVVTSEVAVVDPVGAVTQVTFYVEGNWVGSTTTPPYRLAWSTTNRAVGAIHLQARADTDAGASARTGLRPLVIYTDEDGDGLSDQWEFDHFGSATSTVGSADADGDGVDHLGEFLADTDPLDAASQLRIDWLPPSSNPAPFAVSFPSRTSRIYRIGYIDATADGTWLGATAELAGTGAAFTWVDVPTNAPPATNALRAYRIETSLP